MEETGGIFSDINTQMINLPAHEPVSVLTHLRRALLLEISGGEKRIGSKNEITSWILKHYQENPIVGDMMKAIMLVEEDLVLTRDDLPSLEDSINKLYLLETNTLPEFFFVSSILEDVRYGIMFHREHLKGGGIVYSATLYNLQDLTNRIYRFDIRAYQAEPEPLMSACTGDGWVRIPRDEIASVPPSAFAFQCLAAYYNYKYRMLPLDSIIDEESANRPTNNYLIKLLSQAYANKVPCTRVMVPLDAVQPWDIDHALSIPEERIKAFMPHAIESGRPAYELVLYEKNGQLIMDDDYLAYLAYNVIEIDRVPAVIIGHFSNTAVQVLGRGFSELIPPISVSPCRQPSSRPRLSKQDMLKNKLKGLAPANSPQTQFESVFIKFCRLLGNKSTVERDLHKFIKAYPQILDCHLAKLYSEVRIGNCRADLVLQYNQADKRIVLIELERHSDEIFTKTNQLRHKVTHAIKQVNDWIRQIRENKQDIPDWLQGNYVVEGLVVIGRSRKLTAEKKEVLFGLNTNQTVKVITYDDLLERMHHLINALDQ
ncbi:Shedu anti-phage system protein SduA domain-containing protein [Pseudomonas frederiksbergensis]|uniref:Shedu anti-phage system protein SduA domain-containing protein n=1 Tax=Pseudomonas frederiksbergensis TaxID=104087 RepID=UPI003D25F703